MRMRTRKVFVCVAVTALGLGCDENKSGTLEASTSATASVAATPSVTASSPPPVAAKKKEWKCAGTATVVDFAGDTALEKEIRFKLKKPEGPISPGELADPVNGIKSVNLTKYGPVSDLNPCVMPLLTQIHDLFVSGDLDDLTPIANLTTMISLRVTGDRIKNLDPLKKLVHMDRLDLSHTQISDISVVAQMTDLTELELDQTNVTDLTPLSKLTKLNKVTLANTMIKDVSPLKNSKDLKVVDISGTQITDTSMLQGKNLKIKN
jgi:internalin A